MSITIPRTLARRAATDPLTSFKCQILPSPHTISLLQCQPSQVYLRLDVDGIASGEVLIVKDGLSCESREPTRNVHVALGLLEGLAVQIRSKCLRDAVRPCHLVQEGKTNGLPEGKRQKVIVLRAHEDEKQGHVCPFTGSVTVEVDTHAHAVSMWAGPEWGAVQAHGFPLQGIAIPASDVRNLPYENAVGGSHVLNVLS